MTSTMDRRTEDMMGQEDIPPEQKEVVLSRKRRGSMDIPPKRKKMMLIPQRRGSMDAPPDLADSMNKLKAAAAEFIERFDRTEPEMRDIVKELMKISEEVKTIQDITDVARTTVAVIGGVGMLMGLIAAPFTKGLSLIGPGIVLAAGGSTVVGSNVAKVWKENEKVKEVEKWGEKIMELMEPLKEKLEEIKIISAEWERQSSHLMAKLALRDVEELKFLLRKCKKLQKESEGVLVVVAIVLNGFRTIKSLFSLTPTPTEDEKLRQSIIQTADQTQEVIDQFVKMRSSLNQFMEGN